MEDGSLVSISDGAPKRRAMISEVAMLAGSSSLKFAIAGSAPYWRDKRKSEISSLIELSGESRRSPAARLSQLERPELVEFNKRVIFSY